MSTAKTAVCGVLAVALLAWAWVGREPRARLPEAAAAAPEPPAEAPPADDRAAELDEPRAPLRSPVAPPPAPPPLEAADTEAPLSQGIAFPSRTDVPAGSLEVLVQQDGRPLAGARVLLHGLARGGPPQELERLLEHGSSAVTGADGVATFQGVVPDTYALRVLALRLPVLEITAVQPSSRGAAVLAAYGTSAVEGKVYDEGGAPLDACWILVRSQSAPSGNQWSHLSTATGPDGAYRVEGVLAGVAWISRTCDPEESVSIALEPGALERVDFGWPGGAPTWKGTVRGMDGAALDAEGLLSTQRLENGERSQFDYGADGSFEVRLRPGRYAISATGFDGSSILGEVEIPLHGLTQDVTLPLGRVDVEIDYTGGSPDAQRVRGGVGVWLRSPAGVARAGERLSSERLVFRCVPPGDYELVVRSLQHELAIGAPADQATPLSVPPETAVVRARIAIGDPPGAERP